MKTSFGRAAIIIVIVLLAALVGRRYIDQFVVDNGVPRTVAARLGARGVIVARTLPSIGETTKLSVQPGDQALSIAVPIADVSQS
jgi:hypothetical protein